MIDAREGRVTKLIRDAAWAGPTQLRAEEHARRLAQQIISVMEETDLTTTVYTAGDSDPRLQRGLGVPVCVFCDELVEIEENKIIYDDGSVAHRDCYEDMGCVYHKGEGP